MWTHSSVVVPCRYFMEGYSLGLCLQDSHSVVSLYPGGCEEVSQHGDIRDSRRTPRGVTAVLGNDTDLCLTNQQDIKYM